MGSEHATLRKLRRYEDPGAGIFEEFLDSRLGPGRALALLSGPLADARATGWVLCPTIGPEHGNLRRLEALVARGLAASGFPVLRIRPDADPLHREIDLARRLEELEAAVALLRAETGAERVGVAGTLFGGTLAALAADRLGLAELALVQPATRGRQYARELLRREAVAQLLAGDEEAPPADGPMHDLSTSGLAWIRGLSLSQEAFDAISAVKLAEDLKAFRGRSLLVEISPGGAVSSGVQKLADRLAELGGEVAVEPVADPLHAPLGEYYYRDAGLLRIDTRLELDRKVADTISAWALEGAGAAAASRVA
jgi:hypothetical protein